MSSKTQNETKTAENCNRDFTHKWV